VRHRRARVEFRDRGFCGFDIAGPEDGSRHAHLRAFHLVASVRISLTIHAASNSVSAIWEAVQFCNASDSDRVRIADDIIERTAIPLGRLATSFATVASHLRCVPLERAYGRAAVSDCHAPIDLLRKLRFV